MKQLEYFILTKREKEKTKYLELVAKLDAYSPLKTLIRGYTILEKNGKIIRSQKELQKDDQVTIRLTDGKKQAKILE